MGRSSLENVSGRAPTRKDATTIVLAGGLGTRLQSVVADRRKVLAEVRGRPFLAYCQTDFPALWAWRHECGAPATMPLRWVGQGRSGCPRDGQFLDIGRLESDDEAEQFFAEGAAQ